MTSPTWRLTLLPAHADLEQALHSLNQSGLQIALVVDADETLLGTLTDGDIRRALTRGLTLQSLCQTAMCTQAVTVAPTLSRQAALQQLQTHKIRQLPIVDAQHRVVGLHVLDELLAPAPNPHVMVIMAGGQGQRLMPLTQDCPKPLLPVAGKPMLEHIIERAQAQGFQEFVIAVHYLGHKIQTHLGDGSRWGVRLHYLNESQPLGTAGALSLLTPQPRHAFVVINGDVLSEIRYDEMLAFHAQHKATATMAVRSYEWQHPYGVVHTDGLNIVGLEEKPTYRTHVNAGIYVLAPEALDLLKPNTPCDMPSLFERLRQAQHTTVAFPMQASWLDIGRPEDLHYATQTWR